MCSPSGKSKWGCIWAGSTSNIATIITDANNNVLFPDRNRYPRDQWHRFILPGYDGATSDVVSFVNAVDPVYVDAGTTLRVWYAEDLNDFSEGDDSGRHCIDVYAKISDQF